MNTTNKIISRLRRKILIEFVDSLSDLRDLAIQMNPGDLFDLGIHISPACKSFLKTLKSRDMIGIAEAKLKLIEMLDREGAKYVVNSSQKPAYIDGEYFGSKQLVFVI